MAVCLLMFPLELRVHGVKFPYPLGPKFPYPLDPKVFIPLPTQSFHTFTLPVLLSTCPGLGSMASDADPRVM